MPDAEMVSGITARGLPCTFAVQGPSEVRWVNRSGPADVEHREMIERDPITGDAVRRFAVTTITWEGPSA